MSPRRSIVLSALAGVLIWCVLVLPTEPAAITVGALARIPLLGLVLVGVALVVPARARRPAGITAGVALTLLVLLKVLDIGFATVLDRRFHGFYDGALLGAGLGLVEDRYGRLGAVVVVVAAAVVLAGLGVLLVLATGQVARALIAHRRRSLRAVTTLALVWVVCAGLGVQVAGGRLASTSSARLAAEHATSVYTDYRDQQVFARTLRQDPFAGAKGDQLLTALRGKDVLIVFAESYGRAAVTDPVIAPGVTDVLESGSERLGRVGFSARSGYLTSPTFGAGSWLAHASLQAGVWVDGQHRYDQLLGSDRLTLTDAFRRAGWRTTFVLPAVEDPWPEGRSFYGFDTLLDGPALDYRGPEIGWGDIPDQYTLTAFARSELAGSHGPPLMAEVELVSSHDPWPPTPPLVDPAEVGDGSIFHCMPGCARTSPSAGVRARYGDSIEYTLGSVVSFIEANADRDLVVVLVGDHQPWTRVSGEEATHDVPVTIVARDAAVIRRISGWDWTRGMVPAPGAPVWPMDAFRDRFLTAFGPSR